MMIEAKVNSRVENKNVIKLIFQVRRSETEIKCGEDRVISIITLVLSSCEIKLLKG